MTEQKAPTLNDQFVAEQRKIEQAFITIQEEQSAINRIWNNARRDVSPHERNIKRAQQDIMTFQSNQIKIREQMMEALKSPKSKSKTPST